MPRTPLTIATRKMGRVRKKSPQITCQIVPLGYTYACTSLLALAHPRLPLWRVASTMVERIAAAWSNPRWASFDNAESRLTTYGRHVVGHYRLGEALEGERANLFDKDASP
jgi:hypothetical protein